MTDIFCLPRDILKLLLHKFFDPIAALRCLQTCKYLNIIADRTEIIYKALILKSEKDFEEKMEKLILCPKCFIGLDSKEILRKHLNKHFEMEKKNKVMPCHNPFIKLKCHDCHSTTSNLTSHNCLLRSKYCFNKSILRIFPYFDSLCFQDTWYKTDPNFKDHKCLTRCKFCKKVFVTKKEVLNNHFRECEFKDQILDIYSIRGDRTDDEWRTFLENYDAELCLKKEKEFEKEYLNWKKEQELKEENSKFVQKKYSIRIIVCL